MILAYVLLLLLLVVARYVIARRVAALEKKYVRTARATDELFKAQMRPGNASKPDAYATARQAYLLGQAVERRERVETRYVGWQKFAQRFGALVEAVRAWRGRKLPYLVGALDVLTVLGALDYLGYHDRLNAHAVVELLSSLVSRHA
jgi:hypothetical protein